MTTNIELYKNDIIWFKEMLRKNCVEKYSAICDRTNFELHKLQILVW